VEQANEILKTWATSELELVAEVAATIFASPNKSGRRNFNTAIKQAKNLFNEVFQNQS